MRERATARYGTTAPGSLKGIGNAELRLRRRIDPRPVLRSSHCRRSRGLAAPRSLATPNRLLEHGII